MRQQPQRERQHRVDQADRDRRITRPNAEQAAARDRRQQRDAERRARRDKHPVDALERGLPGLDQACGLARQKARILAGGGAVAAVQTKTMEFTARWPRIAREARHERRIAGDGVAQIVLAQLRVLDRRERPEPRFLLRDRATRTAPVGNAALGGSGPGLLLWW